MSANTVVGNEILKWSISGAPAKAVIALAYIFVGVCKWDVSAPKMLQSINKYQTA